MKKNCKFGANWDKIGSNVYSGTAEFGKDYTIITTIITLIICVFFLLGGIALMLRKPVYTLATTMKITTKNQNFDINKNSIYNYTGTTPECGTKQIQLYGADNQNFNVNDSVPVFIKADKSCSDAHYSSDNFKGIGILFIVLSLIIAAFSLINMFFVKKYKGVAAAEGAMGIFNMFRR